jgi:CubicO group peptidase (beta-lactamase class C family)
MSLPPLPSQPAGTPWPTRDWPTGELPAGIDRARLDGLLSEAFDGDSARLGETHALVVIQGGRLVLERYGKGRGPEDTCHSWSKAKSITQALVGILAMDGRLDIHAPADVPEWSGAGDPRSAITLDQLLRMSSGLKFTEVYLPDQPSDVIPMLFGEGAEDVAAFAAAMPLAHEPGAFWSYSSGTTNIVSRIAARALGAAGPDFEAFMRARLFDPLGMTSATPKFDAAGTFIGSSFCFATPRDFARFGLLYLRDGVWEGKRLLPEGWVDYARTKTWQQEPENTDSPYGAHWWLGMAGPGSFSANGYDGQYTVVIPDLDMVVVRHGVTPAEFKDDLQGWLKEVVATFR